MFTDPVVYRVPKCDHVQRCEKIHDLHASAEFMRRVERKERRERRMISIIAALFGVALGAVLNALFASIADLIAR